MPECAFLTVSPRRQPVDLRDLVRTKEQTEQIEELLLKRPNES